MKGYGMKEDKDISMGEDISRRSLVGGAAIGALGLLGAGLAGCSPRESDSDNTNSGNTSTTIPTTWNEEADIVVIGSGGGMAGAIVAAEAGLDVLVLEKMLMLGGSTALHSGVMACGGGTSIQREAGFTDSPEAYAKYLLACARGQANENLVYAMSKELPDTFEWLVDLGVPFTTEFIYYTGPEEEPYCAEVTPPVMHGVLLAPDAEHPTTGGIIHSYVVDEAENKGVRIMTETSANRLITNAEGEVIGVVAQSSGKTINIKAKKGVLLAGGGMCNNPEMLGQYMRWGEQRTAAGGKGSTGDTIKMAQAIGADLMNMHESLTSPSTAVTLGTTTRGKERASFPSIIVNKWGQRYVNEDYHSDTVGKLAQGQEDGLSWQIFDSKSIEAVRDNNKSALIESDDIEDLAKKAGIFETGLVNTVNRWNEYAQDGLDPDYAKTGDTVQPFDTPPFYAFPLPWTIAIVVQYGGIKVDENCQVISVFGETIPRLYCAGIDAGGWFGRNYPGSGHGAGGSYAMARIAARKLIEYTNWDE